MRLHLFARDSDGKDVELETSYPPFMVKEAEDFVRKTGHPAGDFTKLVDERDPTVLRWVWVWFHKRNGTDIPWGEADFDLSSYSLVIRREPGEPGYTGDDEADEVKGEDDLPTTSGQEGGETAE